MAPLSVALAYTPVDGCCEGRPRPHSGDRYTRPVGSFIDRPSTWSVERPGRVLRVASERAPELVAGLQGDGIEVRGVESAKEALRLLRDFQPDLVMIPPTLEDMDLSAFLKALRRHPQGRMVASLVHFPVATDDASLVSVLDAGADDVVAPCSLEVLRARVRTRIQAARTCQGLSQNAMKDPLTGVFSRGFFLANLRMRVSRLLRNLADRLCLILIDVDEVRAGLDPDTADQSDTVLRRIASVLDLACREGDLVARYGGRTFVLTLSGASQTQGAVVADRLRRTIEDEDIEDLEVTVSCGVAAWETQRPTEGTGEDVDPQGVIEALLRGADAALEDAKRRGPNRVSSNAWNDPAFAALVSGGSSQLN